MRLYGVIVLLVWLGWAGSAAAQELLDEEFGSELDWGVWCPCQIDMQASPVTFPAEGGSGNHVARIEVGESQIGGNKCRSKAPKFECRSPAMFALAALGLYSEPKRSRPDQPEALGPSLVDRALPGIRKRAAVNRYCTDAEELRAHRKKEEDECIQRQELRLQKSFEGAAAETRTYVFRFRIDGDIKNKTDSLRWITAQWKQEPVSKAYEEEFGDEWAPSPFLAQRFDDGILHVTVQDEHCRCKVASAPYPDGSNLEWTNGDAKYCESTRPDNEGEACEADLRVEYGNRPVLTSPSGTWVEMTYVVKAGRAGSGVIEVMQDGRKIVLVTGSIGYRPSEAEASLTKFKIGHYRDFQPFSHAMEIDRLTIEKGSN